MVQCALCEKKFQQTDVAEFTKHGIGKCITAAEALEKDLARKRKHDQAVRNNLRFLYQQVRAPIPFAIFCQIIRQYANDFVLDEHKFIRDDVDYLMLHAQTLEPTDGARMITIANRIKTTLIDPLFRTEGLVVGG